MIEDQKLWEVQRHGGRACDKWIPLYIGHSEEIARNFYLKFSRSMRQGSLELKRDGSIMEEKSIKRKSIFGVAHKNSQ